MNENGNEVGNEKNENKLIFGSLSLWLKESYNFKGYLGRSNTSKTT